MLREEFLKEVAVVDPTSWIDKVNLNARVELFIWRMCKDAVPTKDYLMKSKLAISNMCTRGCGEVEDVDHVTTNCPKMLKVISILINGDFFIPIFNSFHQCMDELKSLSGMNSLMAKMYFSMLWYSWSNKNKSKHVKVEDSESIIAANVVSFVSIDKLIKVLSNYWDAGIIIDGDNKNVIQVLQKVYNKEKKLSGSTEEADCLSLNY
ncbi:uncharacterized protein LOC110098940 [Dendrobium catenatum]|uniref:uncharacterized protein LOC110098940 n=1 Tax=Dendrobium catenatum TaxID=906689 RepID=UPI0009F46128|nr:uncharacterized protein LOC110098940 [Dendrobium catenatum]